MAVTRASSNMTLIARMRQFLCSCIAEVGEIILQLPLPRSLQHESLISPDWLVIVI
ncbi:MAG: hypothetical protein HKO74_13470 [Woeseiaceae bacterium]|nr:hypothetical protein [Woeseiaceae bacterium]